MQMNVSLTKELHEIVQKKVKSGFYSNASEVIRDAIRKLEKEEKKENAWFKLNSILEDAEKSGRSTNSIDEIVKKSLSKYWESNTFLQNQQKLT
jgi:antitoxin ParD1/3/4